jgi:aspartate aminotransferase
MVADRVKQVIPSKIRELSERAKKIENVISLGIGEPDFDTPVHIKEAAKKALDDGLTGYTENQGLFKVRKAISDRYMRLFSTEVHPQNILLTAGAYEAVYLTFMALMNRGDEVLIPDPIFLCYENDAYMSDSIPVRFPLHEEDSFRPSQDEILERINDKTKMLVLNYPSNPTGGVLEKNDYKMIADICEDHNLYLLSDDTYEEIVFDGYKSDCFLNYYDKTVVTNSFSKNYAMTGWRVGFVIAEKEMLTPMLRIHQYAVSCLNTPALEGTYTALTSSQKCVEDMVKEYEKRRNLIVKGLNKLPGVSCINPKGTFYCFANITETGMTSREFSDFMLDNAKVVVVPGDAFGDKGEGFIRCSFATDYKKIEEALLRMETALKSI